MMDSMFPPYASTADINHSVRHILLWKISPLVLFQEEQVVSYLLRNVTFEPCHEKTGLRGF